MNDYNYYDDFYYYHLQHSRDQEEYNKLFGKIDDLESMSNWEKQNIIMMYRGVVLNGKQYNIK